MGSIAERIIDARTAAGLRQTQLADMAGCGQSLIGNLEAGAQKASKWVPAIAAVLSVEPLWLADGIGPMRRGGSPALVSLTDHPDLKEVPRVRFKLSAGVSGYAVEPENGNGNGNGKPVFFRRDWFESNHYRPDKLFAVRVAGASMEPALYDGDLVVVNTADTTLQDGDAFALNYEGELVIKRLRRDAGEWWATSDAADQRRFAPKRCTDDVKIVGRVIYKQSERV
jgi:phage repressor protein C with HTH and peptisase S24 domain